ncbi:MAG: thiolase family protein [Bifidobacterium aquikefiri]|uniref:Probable acetyl-CoA acetyltransferase n=1 Tax=Bifidobacterium aquikefiri TaxID=1653207 RepID=A0A261G8Y4_9BIFI|nr:thiolase family protein [Bifidobacterium aquikefiri]OZG67864.1 3-ketoacyl-CoA thiolase [Bifidobacterium aquikefiri]
MDKVVIVAAVRTPFGKYRGALKEWSAADLARQALIAAMKQSKVPAASVEGLYLGVAVAAGLGPNVARTVAVSAGMPIESHAVTVNEVCGSSLKALRMAQLSIMAGDAQMLAVGGAESMTRAPMIIPYDVHHCAEDPEHGSSAMLTQPVKAIFKDGLIDSFSGSIMGLTAEHIADAYSVSREAQDEFAYASHRKAMRAVSQHHFDDEIIPMEGLSHDETIRPDTSLLKLASLTPVYREYGSVTAGNAAPLSDGAAMLIIATESKAASLGLKPLGYLGSYAEVGYDPAYMGYAPSIAIANLLKRSRSRMEDYDLYEITEAFAAQVIAVRDSLHIPDDRLNINGGSLALGHPLGASGARLVIALLNNLKSHDLHRGIAALCIGGGQGIAMEVFREDRTL